ncbi:MAG: hypothetical protein WD557_00375 [Dehalococcoidia bacterium]
MTAHPTSRPSGDLPPELRPPTSNESIHDLLAEWMADDSGEQEETWRYLKRALEQTRRDLGMQPLLQRRTSPATSI